MGEIRSASLRRGAGKHDPCAVVDGISSALRVERWCRSNTGTVTTDFALLFEQCRG